MSMPFQFDGISRALYGVSEPQPPDPRSLLKQKQDPRSIL